MSIVSFNTLTPGLVGVAPRVVQLEVTDNLAALTAPGYLNCDGNVLQGFAFYPTDIVFAIYSYVPASNSGTFGMFTVAVAGNGTITLSLLQYSQIISNVSTASATPGTIRAIVGAMSNTNANMTSGNLVGVRGEVDYVGSSGSAYIYGVQGKLIPTGTIASGQFQAGVFGQLNISGATINGGQMAPIWGDYGATSGTLTSETGLYGIAMTNTTAAVLEGQVYLYGGATNLLLLNTNAGLSGTTYFQAAGSGASSWGHATVPPATFVLQISVNGTSYWLPLASSNS
jgi:hypothetical protein